MGILAMFLVAVTSLTVLNSCSKDSKGGDSASTGTGLVGSTWVWQDEGITIKFLANGEGIWKEGSETGSFTYTFDGSEGSVVVNISANASYPNGHTEYYTFYIDGNELYLFDDDGDYIGTLTRQANSNPAAMSQLVGTVWFCNYEEGLTFTLKFLANGNGLLIRDDESYYDYGQDVESFTYTFDGNTGTITMREDDSYSGTSYTYVPFRINGNYMYVEVESETLTFIKQ